MLPLLTLVVLAASPPVVLPWDVKVRPPALPSGASSAAVSVARGECQGVQLLVPPTTDALKVAVRAQPESPRVALYREHFVNVRTASNSEGATGPWPDPLVPWSAAEAALGSTSTEPLVIYVDVCAGENDPARVFDETIDVSRGDAVSAIPLRIEVLPFSLPATSSLPSAFGLSLYSVARGHHLKPESDEAHALLRSYANALLEHRLTPVGMFEAPPHFKREPSGLTIDFGEYDREMGPFFEGKTLPSKARFTSAQMFEAPKDFSDAERSQLYRAWRDHFAQKLWPAALFFYAKDEPKPEDVPVVLQQSARVRAVGGVSVLVTSGFDEKLTPAADIVCPVLNCLFPRPGAQTCKRPMTASELRRRMPATSHLWWYQSCMSHGCDGGPSSNPRLERAFSGWASYMVDHPSTLNRAMGVLAFENGIEGELYWDTVYEYEKGDPWSSVWEFGGNGDGTLFYPGTPEHGGAQQPIASLRLKQIRAGLQDYEYLRLVGRFDPALARSSAEKLARSGYDVTRDARVWDSVREEWIRSLRSHTTHASGAGR